MVSTRHELAAAFVFSPMPPEILPRDPLAKGLGSVPSRNLLIIQYISARIAL
jgi:hypothetical protein